MQSPLFNCGCGKKYKSYPAFSSHRRQKHRNVQVEGSSLPQPSIKPRRGRPTFTLTRHQKMSTTQFYNSLNVIQLGLLHLDEKFNVITTENETDPKQTLDIYEQITCRYGSNEQSCKIFQVLGQFLKLVTLQTEGRTTRVIGAFVGEIARFLSNYDENGMFRLDWEPKCNNHIINVNSFGEYFKRKHHSNDEMPLEFFLELTVILCNWLFQMGYCDQAIKRKL